LLKSLRILKSLASIFPFLRWQSLLIFSILNHPWSFMYYYYHLFGVFNYYFQVSFNLKEFLHGKNNSKYCDWAHLTKPIELERFMIHTLTPVNSKIDNLPSTTCDLNIFWPDIRVYQYLTLVTRLWTRDFWDGW